MTIATYNPAHESAHYAILDRMDHARSKHPGPLTFAESLHIVLDELAGAEEALGRGGLDIAMGKYRDAGASLYRAMEDLQRFGGVGIR